MYRENKAYSKYKHVISCGILKDHYSKDKMFQKQLEKQLWTIVAFFRCLLSLKGSVILFILTKFKLTKYILYTDILYADILYTDTLYPNILYTDILYTVLTYFILIFFIPYILNTVYSLYWHFLYYIYSKNKPDWK